MYICETCGKEVLIKFGSGRFCCRACANKRKLSDETKEKISSSLKRRNSTDKIPQTVSKKEQRLNDFISRGLQLADKINLKDSPYCEYNTAFERNQVGTRRAYKLCLYENGALLKSEIVLVYRYNMSCKVGRKLQPQEIVHHKDGNKTNDDISNLELMSRSNHCRLHAENNTNLKDYVEKNGPWNKGLKNCYTEDSIEKMRTSAIKRHHREHH